MSKMAVPPKLRAGMYYATFIGGVAISSIQAGLLAAEITFQEYPIWLKIIIGAWPAWTAAFGLTAGSHVPINEDVVTPSERYPDYVPDRVLDDPEELEDADLAGEAAVESNQGPMTEPIMSPFFKGDTDPNQPKLFRP